MSGYMGLSDIGGECPTTTVTCAVKFCSMGFVTSTKWTSVFLVIADGNIRIYDCEKTYMTAPLSFAEEIHLDRFHTCSAVKRKAYSQNGGRPVDFFCFYIEIDNGALMPTRILKIACLDHDEALRVNDCVKAVSSA